MSGKRRPDCIVSLLLGMLLAGIPASAEPPKKAVVEIRQGVYVERVDPSVDYKSRLKTYLPRSPEESLKTFHLAPGFRLELAAAEPQICSPVDAAFDAYGRLFVAEMIPYAEHNSAAFGSPRGRIVMLEDLDGDGRFEKSTVFCDNLVWPTGLACFDGGLFVAAAPDLWYAKDTDGDGRADVREKLCAMDADHDLRVRYQLAFTLGDVGGAEATAALARIAARNPSDRWIRVALFSSCYARAGDLLVRLAADRKWRAGADARALLEHLAEQVGLQDRTPQVAVAVRVLEGVGEDEKSLVQSLVRGLAWGLAKVGSPLREKIAASGGRVARVLTDIVAQAKIAARQENRPLASRIEAVGMLGLAGYAEVRDAWPDMLSSRQPKDLQMAALETLGRFADPEVGRTITAAWPTFSPTVRSEAAEVLFARRQWLPALLEALEKKVVQPSQIDPARIQVLLAHRDPQIRKRAEELLGREKLGRRKDVVAAYRDVLKLKGDTTRGKDVFKRNCSTCHRLEDVGYELGLPLTTMQNKGSEFILLNLLDPNLQVLPDYINYVCITTDGRSVTGMIVSETASNVTLRRAEGQTDTVLRSNIDELQSTGLSIMPEGLEKQLTKQELADVVAYLISLK